MRNLILGACCLSLLSSCGNIGGGALSGASLGAVVGSAIGGIVGGAHGSDLGTLVGAAAGAAGGAAVVSAAEKKAQRSDGEIVEYNDAAESILVHVVLQPVLMRLFQLVFSVQPGLGILFHAFPPPFL